LAFRALIDVQFLQDSYVIFAPGLNAVVTKGIGLGFRLG